MRGPGRCFQEADACGRPEAQSEQWMESSCWSPHLEEYGKAKHEEKLERIERTIYITVLGSDETNGPYLARHDFQLDELTALQVTLRRRGHTACFAIPYGQKKEIVMDSAGKLEFTKLILL